MEPRMNIAHQLPAAYKSMLDLSAALGAGKLGKMHRHLIKVRASQINGCVFCLDMHTKEARKDGETEQRLYLLNAWKETNLYSDEEKAILAITEEVTLISQHGLTDTTYNNALKHFDEHYVAEIIMSTVLINAWNRIAISTLQQIPM